MATSPRGSAPRRLLAVTLGAAALLAAGCAASGPRPVVTQSASAVPEANPTMKGTVQGAMALNETEQVVVRMGRGPDGRPVVLKVISPTLTAAQEEEVQRAFAIGDWRRVAPLPQASDTWIETLTRQR